MAIILLFYTPKTLYIITNAIAILLRRLKCLPAFGRTASGIAVPSFLVIFYGVTWGRCNYKIEQQQVCIEGQRPATRFDRVHRGYCQQLCGRDHPLSRGIEKTKSQIREIRQYREPRLWHLRTTTDKRGTNC